MSDAKSQIETAEIGLASARAEMSLSGEQIVSVNEATLVNLPPRSVNYRSQIYSAAALDEISADEQRERAEEAQARQLWDERAAKLARADVLLRVNELQKLFPIRRGFLGKTVGQVRAVDQVSFTVRAGETLSLVGESGCGKTTLAKCVLRALDPTAGEIFLRLEDGETVDVARLSAAQLRPVRRRMQMIFQDPFSSLNPRMTLLEIIGEPLLVNGMKNTKMRTARVAELLELVGLRAEYLTRFPHAFSGGQRQRIGIARALALNPSLVVADEAVSALDVSVQAQVLNLMLDLQERLGLAFLFVAHDLSVVKHVSDRVAVMYTGRIVELADTRALFEMPQHPYTEALLAAVPVPDPRRREQTSIVLPGGAADAANPPTGCHFHPRCAYVVERCRTDIPALEEIEPNHFARCHRARELTLRGIGGGERANIKRDSSG